MAGVRRPLVTLLLLCGFTFFLRLGAPAITDSDEAFYAEASREMVESGDWLTPRFNYEDRWQKPVLYYWLTAAAFLLTGPTEGAARFWAAVSGAGLVLLTWRAGRSLMRDERAAWTAGAIAATCFGYLAMARAALPDLPLTFFITLIILAAFEAADRRTRSWWALAGLGAGLGFLMKGPVAIVIPAIVLVPLAWRERRDLQVDWTGPAIAAAVAAITGLPWYAAMLSEHGWAYAESFFIGDNFERFATDRFNEPRPLWFYLPVVIGGMLPWSAYLVTMAVGPIAAVARRTRALGAAEWRLAAWVALPLIFYTLSVGKQPRYILPVLPPLAVLLGAALARRTTRAGAHEPALAAGTWATAALFVVAALLLFRLQPIVALPAPLLAVGGLAVGGSAGALAVVARRRAWPRLPATMAVAGCLFGLTVQFALLTPPRPEPVERMARLVARLRAPGERVGVYRAFVRNLVFYTGMRHDDLFDEATAVDFVRSPSRVLLVLPAPDVASLEAAAGVRLHPLGEVSYLNTANLRLRTLLQDDASSELTRVLLVANR